MNQKANVEQLNDIVAAEYQKLHDSNVPSISSEDIAGRAHVAIDPQNISPPAAKLAAFLKLKKLAEELLEKRSILAHGEDEAARLRKRAEAAIAHADALDAETQELINVGRLSERPTLEIVKRNNDQCWTRGEDRPK